MREQCLSCGMWKHIHDDPQSWECPNCGTTNFRYTWAMLDDDLDTTLPENKIKQVVYQIKTKTFGEEYDKYMRECDEEDEEEMRRMKLNMTESEYYDEYVTEWDDDNL